MEGVVSGLPISSTGHLSGNPCDVSADSDGTLLG
jgi:hypothetical protein